MSNNSGKSQTTVVFKSKFNDNKRNKGPNQGLQCRHCGIKGHIIEKCFKLVGYPKEGLYYLNSTPPGKSF